MGLPIFIEPGWYDVIPLVVACGMLYLAWRLAHAHPTATSPACARCGYSLRGLGSHAPCPECGATPTQRVHSFHRFRWAMLLWTWGSVLLFIALVRVGPVEVSRFSDIHIKQTVEWNSKLSEHAAYDFTRDYIEVVALRGGFRLGYGDYGTRWFPIYEWKPPIEVKVSNSSHDRLPFRMHIDEHTGTWTTDIADGGPTTGSAVTPEVILRMLRAADVKIDRPLIDQEATEIAAVLRLLATPGANPYHPPIRQSSSRSTPRAAPAGPTAPGGGSPSHSSPPASSAPAAKTRSAAAPPRPPGTSRRTMRECRQRRLTDTTRATYETRQRTVTFRTYLGLQAFDEQDRTYGMAYRFG